MQRATSFVASAAARYSIASVSSGRPLARLDAGPTSPPTAVPRRSRDHPRVAPHGPASTQTPARATPGAGLDGDCGQQIALYHPTPSCRGTLHRLWSPRVYPSKSIIFLNPSLRPGGLAGL